jgi:hypothetical protein
VFLILKDDAGYSMREKSPKSRQEIECLLLEALREYEGCEGAAGILVTGCFTTTGDFRTDEPNWTISAFNAGTASDYVCERALMEIVSRLQRLYELVQKH